MTNGRVARCPVTGAADPGARAPPPTAPARAFSRRRCPPRAPRCLPVTGAEDLRVPSSAVECRARKDEGRGTLRKRAPCGASLGSPANGTAARFAMAWSSSARCSGVKGSPIGAAWMAARTGSRSSGVAGAMEARSHEAGAPASPTGGGRDGGGRGGHGDRRSRRRRSRSAPIATLSAEGVAEGTEIDALGQRTSRRARRSTLSGGGRRGGHGERRSRAEGVAKGTESDALGRRASRRARRSTLSGGGRREGHGERRSRVEGVAKGTKIDALGRRASRRARRSTLSGGERREGHGERRSRAEGVAERQRATLSDGGRRGAPESDVLGRRTSRRDRERHAAR